LVLVDALRYDFIEPGQDQIYRNKLTIIKDKLQLEPHNSLLFRTLADPPTTTLQRLIAIVTGELPTLVDAGSNFGSFTLAQDNLIFQLTSRGKRVISIGDDTWNNLFPNHLNLSYPYPSFDVWDLHTVDNGVKSHLFPILDSRDDFGLLIAHFLGVDHAGHRYGPAHVEMAEKLAEINLAIERILNSVDNETLVVVMGDHGMDSKGDHGGDSDAELSAGLFFYSKKRLSDLSLSPILLEKQTQQYSKDWIDNFVGAESRTIPQIDFVSTVSLLLGVGIPFGNLGMVIPELFDINTNGKSSVENIVDSIALNARQVHGYLQAYEKRNAKGVFDSTSKIYQNAQKLHLAAIDREGLISAYLEFAKYLRQSLVIARGIWSVFDFVLITLGSIVLILSAICIILYSVKALRSPPFMTLLKSGLFGMFVGSFQLIRNLAYTDQAAETIALTRMIESLFFGIVLLLARLLVWQSSYPLHKPNLKTEHMSILMLILYFSCVGSDSYTIFEDHVVLYLMQTIHAIMFWCISKEKNNRRSMIRLGIGSFLTRLISLSTICRPDQGPTCIPTFNMSSESSVASMEASFIFGALCVTMMAMIGTLDANFKRHQRYVLYFRTGLFLLAIYSICDTAESHGYVISGKRYIAWAFWINNVISLFKGPEHKSLIWLNLMIFQKPVGGIIMVLGFVYLNIMGGFKRFKMSLTCLNYLAGQLLFYGTGHQNALASIQYEMGFVGLYNVNWIMSPFFVYLNTMGGVILGALYEQEEWMSICNVMTTCVFTGHFARHSQAYRVWGPKFLFGSLSFVTILVITMVIGKGVIIKLQ
jgi:phosphatidylinositol glycan class O